MVVSATQSDRHNLYPMCRKKRDVHPTSIRCWPTEYDAGPTLNQFYVNISLFLGENLMTSGNKLNMKRGRQIRFLFGYKYTLKSYLGKGGLSY